LLKHKLQLKNGQLKELLKISPSPPNSEGYLRLWIGAWRNSTETQPFDHARTSRSSTWCAVPALLSRGGPKWRDNHPEESNSPAAPNRLDFISNFDK